MSGVVGVVVGGIVGGIVRGSVGDVVGGAVGGAVGGVVGGIVGTSPLTDIITVASFRSAVTDPKLMVTLELPPWKFSIV